MFYVRAALVNASESLQARYCRQVHTDNGYRNAQLCSSTSSRLSRHDTCDTFGRNAVIRWYQLTLFINSWATCWYRVLLSWRQVTLREQQHNINNGDSFDLVRQFSAVEASNKRHRINLDARFGNRVNFVPATINIRFVQVKDSRYFNVEDFCDNCFVFQLEVVTTIFAKRLPSRSDWLNNVGDINKALG